MIRIIKTPIIFLLFSTLLYSQDYSFSVSKIPENLTSNANSVIRFQDISIEIQAQDKMIFKVKTAVTVLNKLGDQHKYISVDFDKNQKIKEIKTLVYDAFGNEIEKVKSKEYEEVSAVDGSTLYGDSKVLYYRYVPTVYPYTIYSEYEIETINTGFVPDWRPISSYLTAVESSTYNLVSAEGLKVRFKEKNFEDYTIEKETSETSLSFKIENIPAIKREPYSPRLAEITPVLITGLYKFNLEGIKGEAANWSEFGKWQYDYLKAGNDHLLASTKMEVSKLVEGINDPIEKAKIIYKYVQDRTRYISVQVGIGGWMPIPADVVHRLGYGDCKGLTNYTKTLLDAVGIESYYTVIWAGDNSKDIDKDFFSMQGNHIILNLPTEKEDIWLECTNQKVPFGYLGDFTDDRDALVITPNGGIIKHTQRYAPEDNYQHTKGSFEIDANGTIKAQVKINSKGTQYMDNLLRNDGESQQELENLFKEYLSYINNIKFSKIEVFNNREAMAFEEEIEFSATNYATTSGSEMLIPINAFNRNSAIPNRVRNRKLPFEISHGYVDVDEIEITLPSTLQVVYVPENKLIESDYGEYIVEVSKIDEYNYLYKRTIRIEEGKHPKEDYDLYRTFRKNIRKYDNSKIVLKSK
ncbi:Transglutaminase-like enzyme, putative cysteine protease [Lutibacter agarilyticus]|uniref:Transglutaminase-like enzyme, putative cysteine protease n=1 Tax=Lutibacter agarilyticus TaxID=1109740 RepID=A0A238WEM3_9FLAO|nr:transglutaminase family protein [Lutibacter agarilyticus]SNR44109.1 Transglutaminase-like enzyme, putative cysteine protease [Lutibacter agarilyticus]